MTHSVPCTVYSVMYVQLVVCLFDYRDWQSLSKSTNEISNIKIYIKKLKMLNNFVMCILTLFASHRPSFCLYCWLYSLCCVQRNVDLLCLFSYPDCQNLSHSRVWNIIKILVWVLVKVTIKSWLQSYPESKPKKVSCLYQSWNQGKGPGQCQGN